MKNKFYLSITVIFFLSFTSQAQIEKNNWLLGGVFAFNTISDINNNVSSTGNTSSNANIAPHMAYALGKNSVIGLNFGFNSNNSGGYKSSSYVSNIFYKKYIPCQEKFGVYIQINGGLVWFKNTQTIDSVGILIKSSSTNHEYSAGIIPGVYYQVSKRVLLNANCGGFSYLYDYYGAGNSSTFWSFNFLNSFTFGVDFILGKK